MTTPVPWSMKKCEPMCAPGWMSMPVRLCAHSVIIRGMSGTLERVEDVRAALDGDGLDERIRQDHFVRRRRRGIALERSLDVRLQQLAHLRKAARENRA